MTRKKKQFKNGFRLHLQYDTRMSEEVKNAIGIVS